MSNFEDFDLDLKQVSTTTNTELLSTTTILQSLATTCKSVDTPTTGMTNYCSTKANEAAEPRCI